MGRLNRIDWGHPLARDLIGCYLPGISSGTNLAGNYDLVEGASTLKYIGPDGPAIGGSAVSMAIGLKGSACPVQFKTWTEITLYARYFSFEAAQTNPRAISIEYDSINSSPYIVAGIYINSKTPTAGTNKGAGLVTQAFTTGATWASAPAISQNNLGLTIRVGGNIINYFNGAAAGSSSFGSVSPLSSASSYIAIGSYSSNSRLFGYCSAAYIWNRELSAQEMAWLDAEPFSFLTTAEYEMPALWMSSDVVQRHFRFRTDTDFVDAIPTWGAAEDVGLGT